MKIINADNNNLLSPPGNAKYVVGAGVHLKVIEGQNGTDPITNPNWSLSGQFAVSAETTSTPYGGPGGSYSTPVPNPTGSGLHLYYPGPSGNTTVGIVNVQATLAATSASAEAFISVDAPDVSTLPDGLTSKTGAIGVFGGGTSIYPWTLSFGRLPAPMPTASGITWTFITTTPDDGGGEVAPLQLINSTVTQNYAPPSPSIISGSCGSFELDNTSPYNAPHTPFPIPAGAGASISQADSPNSVIGSVYSGITSLSRNESFHTYLIYKSSASDSIWVTLGELDWGWNATTTWNGTTYASPMPTNILPVPNPTGYPVNTIPIWTAVLRNDEFPTCPP